ncbi:NUDIX domain-containing protein [Novosphingobium sp. BW1]|uniref:NUDIX hydrolase n=1 Tax=Novosphingobium sp. BW1 TaxID=2592621 RepID=UPI0011DE9D49|nr:NUDIX domain-containing protein [Novosphingobium sp. BW1]TYC91848.1 NUDIX hydrolase [Novosphingobium sp. BW1]
MTTCHVPTDPPEDLVPAATVVVFRRSLQPGGPPELLMVKRAPKMRFAAGALVFPGGRVDAEDTALARRLLPNEDEALGAARIAAIRETLEETGLLIANPAAVSPQAVREGREQLLREGALAPVLERMGWELDPWRLTFYAHWCAPGVRPFDTRFFLTDLGSGQVDIAVDKTENTQLFWASARATLALCQKGEERVIFPTRRNLERLARHDSFAEAHADAQAHPPRRIRPVIEHRDDGDWLTIPEGLGYPVCAEAMASAQRG